ncbi:MAG: phosphoglycerate dehydrogenase [Thioalkalivibrio sp.]|nr:phosphoglycerate dehydrogenase [Thioalkalivibrio sp.]
MAGAVRPWRVVSSSPSFGKHSGEPVELLQNAGCEVELLEPRDPIALDSALDRADAWIVGFERVDDELLGTRPRLRVAAKSGAGLDNFDLPYLAQRGVTVVSVPGGNSSAVAEYALAQMLALSRGVLSNDRAVRDQQWRPYVGMALRGRVLGIVGYGAIGEELARMASSLGMSIVVSDPLLRRAEVDGMDVPLLDLPALLQAADIVSLHVPLNEHTRGLIGEAELRAMQPHGLLINDSRGGVVDERALHRALQDGWIAGAAIDVFETEPVPADHPLLSVPGALVSPHTAGYSDEALRAVTLECAHRVLAALQEQEG